MLHFPTARLFIHNVLSDGNNGSAALVRGAYEFGILPAGSCADLEAVADNGACHCLYTAQQVFRRHFASIVTPKAVDVDLLWQGLTERFSQYEGLRAARHECDRVVPVLFDLMLQEIRRHSV